MAPSTVGDPSVRVAHIADELRALAANGLNYGRDPYDIERFHRIRDLAAELMAVVDPRPAAEIRREFRGDLGIRTPSVAVDGAIFDEEGRLLLVQRADSLTWCMPGGAADVGESPSAAAEREVREETGLVVRASRLLGLYDNRTFGVPSVATHAYYIVFACERLGGELTRSLETSDFRWVTEEEAGALNLYRSHVHKVPEAFRTHRSPQAGAAFH
jgi:ADP-ribose pyrophosphatase YjhB (NUDIX family)